MFAALDAARKDAELRHARSDLIALAATGTEDRVGPSKGAFAGAADGLSTEIRRRPHPLHAA